MYYKSDVTFVCTLLLCKKCACIVLFLQSSNVHISYIYMYICILESAWRSDLIAGLQPRCERVRTLLMSLR